MDDGERVEHVREYLAFAGSTSHNRGTTWLFKLLQDIATKYGVPNLSHYMIFTL